MENSTASVSEVTRPGTTLYVIKNGECTFQEGIPLNSMGTRIPVGALSFGLKRGDNFFKLDYLKKRDEPLLDSGVFDLDITPKPPFKKKPNLIRPRIQKNLSNIGIVKIRLEKDLFEKPDQGGLWLLSGPVLMEDAFEACVVIERGKQVSMKLESGRVIDVHFSGEQFSCCYR